MLKVEICKLCCLCWLVLLRLFMPLWLFFSAYFLGYIFFSQLNLIIQKFSIIFFLQNYPLLLERYLSFFGVSILCVLYPFLLLFLFIKTLEKLKKSKLIFIDLFIFILLFCIADLVVFTFELAVKAFY